MDVTPRSSVRGRVLVAGEGRGSVLALTAPLSFWGGVDPKSGSIVDPRHPQAGASLASRVVALPETVGSSSSSAILLELYRNGVAPAALLLGRVDPVLTLGAVVAEELEYRTCPVLALDPDDLREVAEWETADVLSTGWIERPPPS